MPLHLAAADVLCQPSLVEPFGQAALEALACGRSVVGTTVGGPPEFVPAGAGVLVDPLDEEALVAALRDAAALPVPNPAAREAAELHDVRRQAERVEAILERAVSRSASLISTSGLHRLLDPRLARQLERLLVALARLLGRDALLQPVVARDEQALDLGAGLVARGVTAVA